MQICLLALENCMASSITGPWDIFTVAALEGQAPFSVQVVSPDGKPPVSFSGAPLLVTTALGEGPRPDLIFIPVIHGTLTGLLENQALITRLREYSRQGTVIAAVCAGVFLAARTGILQGLRATTHWMLAREFENQFPGVILTPEKMIVDEGSVITAGGVFAYMDLSLYIVARFSSRGLASDLSRVLLIDPVRRSQMPYTAFEFNTSHTDTPILEVQQWLEDYRHTPVSVREMADRALLGLRTFTRRFKAATGETPQKYLQRLRISRARTLLETTAQSVETIVLNTGYEDPSSLRRLFKKATGLSPAAYRRRFGTEIWTDRLDKA